MQQCNNSKGGTLEARPPWKNHIMKDVDGPFFLPCGLEIPQRIAMAPSLKGSRSGGRTTIQISSVRPCNGPCSLPTSGL